jgi:hypothetical protein
MVKFIKWISRKLRGDRSGYQIENVLFRIKKEVVINGKTRFNKAD